MYNNFVASDDNTDYRGTNYIKKADFTKPCFRFLNP